MLLVLLCLLLAGVMAGVGWLVERVVYPQFAGVPPERWPAYHAAHSTRITPVVVGPMVALPLLGAALLLDPPAGAPQIALWLNAVLPAALLAATGLVFGPLHARLARDPSPAALRRLARFNRVRTAAWTAHAVVALWLAAAVT
jgi:hypothetical protein